VYNFAGFILAQLIFAYAFDALLTWSRRDTYTLGFGPFPIIFSINLFLWFKPDWFFLQFLLVVVGFTAKELIRWNKEGRRTHIFNPSSFPLTLFSIVLILTGTTHLTSGPKIALTQFNPPHMYLLIFLVSLPAQVLWGVGSMTLSAVVTAYTFGLLHLAVTGTDFFFGSYIPVAVFLGMHLLVTDPSTSPRTELGRIIFGMLYGLSVIALYALLGHAGTPTFYDKLLAVPILNLMIQAIDRAARSKALRRLDPAALVRGPTPRRLNFAYVSVWTVVFVIMQLQTGTVQDLARRNNVGLDMLVRRQTKEAISHFRELARMNPDYALAHHNLGFALIEGAGRATRWDRCNARCSCGPTAIHHYREAIRLRPNWPTPLTGLAWLRATHADPSVRNPAEAVRLATRANELRKRDPSTLDTLAAAHAADGQFDAAVRTAERAEKLAAESAPALAAQIRSRLNLYRAKRPLVISGGI